MNRSHFDLLPCPFCGTEAELEVLNDHHGYYFNLGCSDIKCHAHGFFYTEPIDSEDDPEIAKAVAKWNGRVGC